VQATAHLAKWLAAMPRWSEHELRVKLRSSHVKPRCLMTHAQDEWADVLADWPLGGSSSRKPAAEDPWILVAEVILSRDFRHEPVDRSTLESLQIGLRGNPHPTAKRGLALLEAVKPVTWGKRDIAAGRLLPRKSCPLVSYSNKGDT